MAVADSGMDLVPALITGLLGGGGALFIAALVKGWSDLRGGARARAREAVIDLAAARDDAENRRAVAEKDRDYWRAIAGRYGYQLRNAGINPDPEMPEAPSDRDRERERVDRERDRRPR